MAAPLVGSMPQYTRLGYNTTVSLEAFDPATGSAVTGVVFTEVEIWADVDDGSGGLNVGDVPMPILIGAANF